MTVPFVPLAELLRRGRAHDHPVAVCGARTMTWAELVSRVAGLARVLDAAPGARWGLFTEDAWAFTVGLLAIWHAGGIAVLPPNGQPGTLKDLRSDVRAVVTDRADLGAGIDAIAALGEGSAMPPAWAALEPHAPRMVLWTSGTSGVPRACVKSVAHLDDEVAAHERRWGAALAGARAIATVSHQHIYGLLFRIAWPLASGRVFGSRALLQPAEVDAALAGTAAAYLVSTPSHLRRLADSPSAPRTSAASCREVFSSGGPLDARTARALADAFGAPPIEVFGSTETGGVAWRRQAEPAPAPWTPFEGVAIAITDGGRLHVASPWVGEPGGSFTMGDSAEIAADGTFVLGPRADRIVKVGERRLALPEMEARLREHPFVAAAALVPVDRRGEGRLAGVVVPSGEGAAVLQQSGRRRLAMMLRSWLAAHWDGVLLPRAWRFVDRLPEDAQGKTSLAALRALFE